MGRLAGFTCRQVTRKLRRLGFEFDRQAQGSHEIWWNVTRHNFPSHRTAFLSDSIRADKKAL